MRIVISNSSSDPIYEQIARQIRGQILSGELDEGAVLPSIRVLAHELQISVITTKRAYDELEREGYIDSVAGKGSYVAMQNSDLRQERKRRLVEDVLAQAVREARLLGVPREDLLRMLNLLFEEEA